MKLNFYGEINYGTKKVDLPIYMTPSEVARLLHVSPVTVRQWSQKGWLKSEKTAGGHRRYLQDEVNRFVKDRGLKLEAEVSEDKKIMIIDDDRQLVSYLVELLNGEDGVKSVDYSYGGFEAGMKVRSFRPDVILLDLMIPKLDGFSVCRIIKNDPLTANVRVLAMTGYLTEENEQHILKEGAEICLAKPIDPILLTKTLGVGKYFEQ